MARERGYPMFHYPVSVLFNESKLLKCASIHIGASRNAVSVLFNESKLLKYCPKYTTACAFISFSTLQRVEIAEIDSGVWFWCLTWTGFSTLQRVEIAEIAPVAHERRAGPGFQYSSTSRNC